MAQKTRAQFQSELDAAIATNGTGAITGDVLNDAIENLKDSALWYDEGPLPAWATGLSTFTPVLTDLVPSVDDPAGTPAWGKLTWGDVHTLFIAQGANASFLNAGTLADARVAASNVTQHQAALTVTTSQITSFSTAVDARITAAINVSVQAYDVATLKADETANLTVGYTTAVNDIGTVNSGEVVLNFALGQIQTLANNGAFTLAPPATGSGTIVLEITNAASAGAITTTGFASVTGDTFTTTNGHKFLCSIARVGSRSYLTVIAASDNA